jgi:hypothetical protein
MRRTMVTIAITSIPLVSFMNGNEVNRPYLILGGLRRYHFGVGQCAGRQINSIRK